MRLPEGGGSAGIIDPGGNGVVVRTALNTTTSRTITAGNRAVIADGDGVAGNPTFGVQEPAPVTVAASTATLADTTRWVEVTVSAATLTLPSAGNCAQGHDVVVRNATSNALLLELTRSGSDTIDAATSRAGMVPPGGMVRIVRTSATTFASSLDIDPRRAMTAYEWRPDASSGNLIGAGAWTQAGTPGASALGGRLYATEARAGSTAATGWTLGSKFFLSDGRPAFMVQFYNDAPTSNQHRIMIGMVDGWYSGVRGSWGGKGLVLQYESGDTNWQAIVRDAANSVHDTGAALAAGHYRLLLFRDGTAIRWIIYYSATDATFAGVAATVGSATPSAFPSATTLQAEIYAAAGASWTGTLGVAFAAFGEML